LTSALLSPLFDRKISSKKCFSVSVQDAFDSNNLVKLYAKILSPENFSIAPIVNFWEERLSLTTGPAGNLYSCLKDYKISNKQLNWKSIIIDAMDQWQGEGREKVEAILAIEPFLALIEKVSNKLLDKRTHATNDDDTINFINYKLKTVPVNISEIRKFCNKSFYDSEGLNRLDELVSIFDHQLKDSNIIIFAESLIAYHAKLMRRRGSLPWLTIDSKHTIKHHRSLYFNEKQLLALNNDSWVNNYYMTTLNNLYTGLHNSHEDL
jgi:hypothetical protein